ncbi:MAG: 3-hydroxyacyl-ACP dehydratase FabZ [Pseudomonadota bacterium]|nr:3-hydroxyacyl-ACP dehydratase FabZ [Pseudomonadota bacterium]
MSESKIVDVHRIREILPHRYPFLLLDRVIDYEIDKSLRAIKNVTINEPFFQGHFPHRPVFPGVMMLEAMAQAAAVLASLCENAQADSDIIYLFAGIDKARFKRQIEPGDQMVIDVELKRRLKQMWKCAADIKVDGELCAKADVLFTYKHL